MYDFITIGKQLAKKYGLVVVEKSYETDYFLISDTSFVWSEVLRTFHHNRCIVFFNTPEKVAYEWADEYDYCFAPYRPEEMNMHFGIDVGVAKEIYNQIKQEDVMHHPEIDFVKLLDDILKKKKKNLNDLLLKTKKSEIIGASKGWQI